MCTESGVLRQAAVTAAKVVDTTGAGDCSTAAFAVGLLRAQTPESALQCAATAPCLCVQKAGAKLSMPSLCEQLSGTECDIIEWEWNTTSFIKEFLLTM